MAFMTASRSKLPGAGARKPVMLDLVTRTRTFRRFIEKKPVSPAALRSLINLARLSASGGNLQPLKFIPTNNRRINQLIFPQLAWAGYLKDWAGPQPGERPAAYIIILGDRQIRPDPGCDHGIAAQSIMLGATELGMGGCIIGSINRPKLRRALRIPNQFDILLTLALGYPREKIKIEPTRNNNIKYWRDAAMLHHVPKRSLKEIILPASR